MSKAPPPTETSSPEWPHATETRTLRCTLAPEELGQKANEMARAQIDLCALEEQKKTVASEYKAKENEKHARINVLAQAISSRSEERRVECKWVFETSGRDDATARMIEHPEHKTLLRTDTAEVVEITRITDSDRQMALPFPKEPVANGQEDDLIVTPTADEDENLP